MNIRVVMNLLKIFRRKKRHADTVELPIVIGYRRDEILKYKQTLTRRESISLYEQVIVPEFQTRMTNSESIDTLEMQKYS